MSQQLILNGDAFRLYTDRTFAILVYKLKTSRDFEHILRGTRRQCDYSVILDAINAIQLFMCEKRDLTVSLR